MYILLSHKLYAPVRKHSYYIITLHKLISMGKGLAVEKKFALSSFIRFKFSYRCHEAICHRISHYTWTINDIIFVFFSWVILCAIWDNLVWCVNCHTYKITAPNFCGIHLARSLSYCWPTAERRVDRTCKTKKTNFDKHSCIYFYLLYIYSYIVVPHQYYFSKGHQRRPLPILNGHCRTVKINLVHEYIIPILASGYSTHTSIIRVT